MPSRSSKNKLVDVREDRNSHNCTMTISKVELRDDRNGDLHLIGYASTFDEYEVYGGPENFGWIEKIDRNAFNRTLSEKPDLHLLINHDGMPLARTKSDTLKLSVDANGLKVDALLDRTDPDVQALIPKMQRGDMDEMSFAFRVKEQDWSAAPGFEHDDMSYRLITELSLQRGDVSVVNFGANPFTSADLTTVGAAVGALAQADLAEARSAVPGIDRDELVKAEGVLRNLLLTDKRANADDMVQGMHDMCADMGAECRDGSDSNSDGGGEENSQKRKRSRRASGGGDIARGIRIEVGGTDDKPEVRFFDASTLLPQDVCTMIAAEVREAVLGRRGTISSGTPAAVQGEAISVKEGLHLIEQTITLQDARSETGTTATLSLAEARAAK